MEEDPDRQRLVIMARTVMESPEPVGSVIDHEHDGKAADSCDYVKSAESHYMVSLYALLAEPFTWIASNAR